MSAVGQALLTGFWHETVPFVSFWVAMQQISPLGQSPASLQVTGVPPEAAQAVDVDWQTSFPAAVSQHSIPEETSQSGVLVSQRTFPGVQVLPPVGGSHIAPMSPACGSALTLPPPVAEPVLDTVVELELLLLVLFPLVLAVELPDDLVPEDPLDPLWLVVALE